MLRGRSLKSRLAKLAIAYAIALQGLLGAWGGIGAAHSAERDASLSLCRTLAAGTAQPADETAPVHCVVMCLSGACVANDAPAPASVATEYAPSRIAILLGDDRETLLPIVTLSALSARGPPAIV